MTIAETKSQPRCRTKALLQMQAETLRVKTQMAQMIYGGLMKARTIHSPVGSDSCELFVLITSVWFNSIR